MLNTGLHELEAAVFFLLEASARSRALTQNEEKFCRVGLPHTSYSDIINAFINAFREKAVYSQKASCDRVDDEGNVRENAHILLLHALQARYVSASDFAR